MKLNKHNLFWGAFFILAALFIIFGSMGSLGELSVWTLLFTFLFVAWLINSLVKLEWGGILFSIAFLAIIYDDWLGIQAITPWPVLAAALLGTIGLNMIFHKKPSINVYHNGQRVVTNEPINEETAGEEYFSCETAFGSTVKYVNCPRLKRADIENSFGSLTVYFDNASLNDGRAVLHVENSFGKTTLYIPSDWQVYVDLDESFGHVDHVGQCTAQGTNVLDIVGEVSFGNIEIKYI